MGPPKNCGFQPTVADGSCLGKQKNIIQKTRRPRLWTINFRISSITFGQFGVFHVQALDSPQKTPDNHDVWDLKKVLGVEGCWNSMNLDFWLKPGIVHLVELLMVARFRPSCTFWSPMYRKYAWSNGTQKKQSHHCSTLFFPGRLRLLILETPFQYQI